MGVSAGDAVERHDRALLALAGALPPADRLRDLRTSHRIVVAADGAALALAALGLGPDVVVGDLDSIGTDRRSLELAGTIVVEEPSQESNDFEKALRWLHEQGWRRVTVVGIDGGLLDHTLNNFSVLARFATLFELDVLTEHSHGRCVVDRFEAEATPGDRVSLIPLPSARMTTIGLVWELADEILALGSREGASNRAAGTSFTIDIHEGIILVLHYSGIGAERTP